MKNVLVKLMCILLVVACVFSITNSVYAVTTEAEAFGPGSENAGGGGGSPSGGGGSSVTSQLIKNKFKGNVGSEGSESVKQILSAILSVVRTVGAAIAVVMLMSIGAKYIVASAGDRADIKKYAINYVIGAIILLGATGVLSVVQNIINKSLE